jgi:hypothetical protein
MTETVTRYENINEVSMAEVVISKKKKKKKFNKSVPKTQLMSLKLIREQGGLTYLTYNKLRRA